MDDKINSGKHMHNISRNDWWEYNALDSFSMNNDGIEGAAGKDMVNSPAHYTQGRVEAIEVIEDAITEAPNPMAGFLQAQVLKYILRLWHKIDALEDAEKARWYLNKLIDSLK